MITLSTALRSEVADPNMNEGTDDAGGDSCHRDLNGMVAAKTSSVAEVGDEVVRIELKLRFVCGGSL